LANIGVLVGLAVLIMEIRQNNELTMAQIEQTRSDAFVSWGQEVVLNDHLAPLLAKADQLVIDMYGEPDDSVDAAEIQEWTANILDVLEPVDPHIFCIEKLLGLRKCVLPIPEGLS
jgi:hypothetical protein